MARVLKPTGSIFVELGDSYTNKSLNMSPHRYAIGCVDKLGLILRAEVVWSRSNGLPESVTDRVRRSHSVWFHLVKQPRYYSAIDHIRTPHAPGDPRRSTLNRHRKVTQSDAAFTVTGGGRHYDGPDPLGALPGSVWEVATEPFSAPPELGVDHWAAFPMALPRRIILGWSPAGICTTCGEGRRPIAERVTGLRFDGRKRPATEDPANWSEAVMFHDRGNGGLKKTPFERGVGAVITGEVCGCPDTSAPTRPAVVLDPFSGTGTTCLVAHALGRDGIGVDMSADYCRLAEWRTTDPGQLAKAMGVPKPPKELDGQTSALDLLNELDGGAA